LFMETKLNTPLIEKIRSNRAGIKINFVREMLADIYNCLCLKFENRFFVSFPKCGRTWLRFFVAKYISEKYHAPFMLDHSIVMRLASLGAGAHSAPHYHFTHAGFDIPDESEFNKIVRSFRGKQIHFLVRDPRDVAVSYYWHYQKRQKRLHADVPRNTPISIFLRHPVVGISQIVRSMNRWHQHQNEFNGFFIWRYEDFKRDPKKSFEDLLTALGEKPIDRAAFDSALQYSSFDNMKMVEQNQKIKDPMLSTADLTDPEAFKVRRGIVGGYRDYLSAEDLQFADSELVKLHPDFGYSTTR